jgi:hypothetical protein
MAAVAVVCAGLLSACGSSSGSPTTTAARTTNLDVARVERAIERSILSQRHLKSTVVCPATVPQRPGKFPCIATTLSVKKPHKAIKTPFVVTIHNSKGYVTYAGK